MTNDKSPTLSKIDDSVFLHVHYIQNPALQKIYRQNIKSMPYSDTCIVPSSLHLKTAFKINKFSCHRSKRLAAADQFRQKPNKICQNFIYNKIDTLLTGEFAEEGSNNLETLQKKKITFS